MLTAPQKTAIKAAIVADNALNSKPNNSDGNFEIAAALNATATPDYFVWKPSVAVDTIMQNGFDWTRVDNLTVGKARIWEWMTQLGSIRPNLSNVRAGINAAFSAAADDNTRLAAFQHCQRLATRAEKLLITTGAGTTTSNAGVGPATLGFEGSLTVDDIESARNS